MKKIIALLLCGVLCFWTTAFAAEANQVSEPKEDLAKEFDNDFLKEAEYYVDKDGNFVFTKVSKENSIATRSGISEKECVSDCVVIAGVTEEAKEEIAVDIQKLRSGVEPLSSVDGSSVKNKWDTSGSIKAYLRVYYNEYTYGSGKQAMKITKVTGGYATGSGSAIIGSGVSLKSQKMTMGQNGFTTPTGYTSSQKASYTKTGQNWSQSAPSSWKGVDIESSPYIIGANLTITLGRGTGTWTVDIQNILAQSGLSLYP